MHVDGGTGMPVQIAEFITSIGPVVPLSSFTGVQLTPIGHLRQLHRTRHRRSTSTFILAFWDERPVTSTNLAWRFEVR